MISDNYYFDSEENTNNITSYEEQLLLNYDDYLEGGSAEAMAAHNYAHIEFGELDNDLEYDFDSEYDENDWEELDSDENLAGEYDENEEKPGSFEMIS